MISRNKIIYTTIAILTLSSVYVINMVYSKTDQPYNTTKTIEYKNDLLSSSNSGSSSITSSADHNNMISTTETVNQNANKIITGNSNSAHYSNLPITYSKDFSNNKPVSIPNTIPNVFNMKLYDIKTPSPIPHVDPPPIGWATGLATDMSSIMNSAGTGAKLSGIPGTPFVNDIGGSTLMAELKFDPKDISKIQQNINKFQIKLSFEVMSDIRPIVDTSTNPGLTDGWMFALMQNLDGVGIGGFGDYSDDIHAPLFSSFGYKDLGPTQTTWVKHEFLIPSSINLNTPLQIMFLSEQSSEPTTPQWTLMVRGLRVEAVKS